MCGDRKKNQATGMWGCSFPVANNQEGAMRKLLIFLLSCSMVVIYSTGWAASDEEEMEAMQKQLNKQVMEQPFHAEEPEKVDAYVKEAMKKHLKPKVYQGDHWRRGYTCHDMLRYSWYEYRNCMYYYRYYGYYYPYP
jgi:Ni/Co efflux regulator RcnB